MAKLLNIAHRGGAALWPENTLFAFGEAARAGYDGAELDVQLTGDGKLVVFHDYRLKPELCRTSDGRWLRGKQAVIRDLKLSELRQFDVGRIKPHSLYARSHRVLHPVDGEGIPMLSEVIAAVRSLRQNFRLFIEIKTSPEDPHLSAAPEKVAESVIAELQSKRFVDDAVLVSFDWRALVHAMTLAPAISCWFTTKPRRKRDVAWAADFHPGKFGNSIPRAIAAAGGHGWFASRMQATARQIKEAHRLGLKVGVWTVNDARAIRRFARFRVDAIVSDRPDRVAKSSG